MRFHPGLWREPGEVQRQLVNAAVLWLSGADYAPRAAEVERLIAALAERRDATLAGCRAREGWLVREMRAVGGSVPVGQLWDGRWVVEGPPGEVRALGAEGLRQVKDWRKLGVPREVSAGDTGGVGGRDVAFRPGSGAFRRVAGTGSTPVHLSPLVH